MKSLKKPNNEAIKELLTRGVTEVVDRGHLEAALKSGKKLRVKLGIDPTGPKIHLGNAVILRKLRDFQRLGHKAVLIVGDFTALIGDPSDKLAKRPMLTAAQIKVNLKDYKAQLGKILDLKKTEFHFNSKWLAKLKFAEIAELAETFTVQQMLARRNFKDRIESGTEISLRELLYPLMQGYDSVAIKADVEIGGFDQLFNVLAGRTIQRAYNQPVQDVLTGEMLDGTDGRKMSKSWGNVVNITEAPNEMFGKLMSLRDELIPKYLLLCTDWKKSDIDKVEAGMKNGKINPRDAKLMLAEEIVKTYHGNKIAITAKENFVSIFSKKESPIEVASLKATKIINAVDLIVSSGLVKSKSEARRLVDQGAFRVNDKVIQSPTSPLNLQGGELIKIGKKSFFRIK
ncbi:MAG TPA: tyrosine--tRNA ligase [Candidatus Paceibacterota bacterium]|nr:tyrosine--tRNA ligase [Candidatus Paceibacterota bacterium]